MDEKKESVENIELAEEHVKLAQDLVIEEAKKIEEKKESEKLKHFEKTAFTLEKAEAQIKELIKIVAGFLIIGTILLISILFFPPTTTGSFINVPKQGNLIIGVLILITIIITYYFFIYKKKN